MPFIVHACLSASSFRFSLSARQPAAVLDHTLQQIARATAAASDAFASNKALAASWRWLAAGVECRPLPAEVRLCFRARCLIDGATVLTQKACESVSRARIRQRDILAGEDIKLAVVSFFNGLAFGLGLLEVEIIDRGLKPRYPLPHRVFDLGDPVKAKPQLPDKGMHRTGIGLREILLDEPALE